jgi:hypothetical protein
MAKKKSRPKTVLDAKQGKVGMVNPEVAYDFCEPDAEVFPINRVAFR